MSFLGSGVLRVGDDVFVGSGCHVDSIGSCCCSCGFRVISWDECDTLSKKIGFVFGKVINCMSSLAGKTYSLISKTISVLCVDKLFDFFSRIISGFFDKLCDIATWIFENCIRPIFVNVITQKIGEIITVVFNGINDYLMIPVGIFIKKILSEPSKSCVEKTSVEKEDFKVVAIFKKFLHLISKHIN